ncbi:MAG TPA: P-II family nitrogen regulator, partial [Arthrobacter bacterium]|nr:P-II family nitrogen regulator [Arthrobacter sp.]
VVESIVSAAHTGNLGDGKIWTIDIHEAVRVRTREWGAAAIT